MRSGKYFKKTREKHNISVSDLAYILLISVESIVAIEKEEIINGDDYKKYVRWCWQQHPRYKLVDRYRTFDKTNSVVNRLCRQIYHDMKNGFLPGFGVLTKKDLER